MNKIVYFLILLLIIIPFEQFNIGLAITPAISLFIGLIYALIFPIPFAKFNKKASNYLLDCACSTLSEAKAVHDILESHYINAMNFDKLKEFAEKFCKKIL